MGKGDDLLTKLPATRRYQFEQLHCRTKQTTLKKGVYEIRRFDGLFLETQAGACRVDIETGNPLRIVRDVAERPTFTFRNPSDRTLKWSGVFMLGDLAGHAVTQRFEGIEVPAGGVRRLTPSGRFRARGCGPSMPRFAVRTVRRRMPRRDSRSSTVMT